MSTLDKFNSTTVTPSTAASATPGTMGMPATTAASKTGSVSSGTAPKSKASMLTKVTTFTFVGMTCALVASIRNIPDVAATGWTMFFYMFVAVFLFGLPVTLISGEYAGMYPSAAGGPELWTSNALGQKWGFVTSWLLWVQLFPGMVMVGSVLAPMLAVGIGRDSLGQNNIFILVMILVVYWAVTLLNLKFDMAKIGGKWGIWLMLYIPAAMLFILGIAATIKTGLKADSVLGTFSPEKLLPIGESFKSMQYLAPIIFIFCGIEMSSVYIKRLQKPVKQYTSGIFAALAVMLVVNLLSAFIVANAVPDGKLDLNNVAQPIILFCQVLGIPTIIGNIFGFLVFIGVMVQLSAWITGPSKTITQSARRGQYPPKFKFWKTNKLDVSKTVLITQAAIISIFSLVYLLIPAANSAFLTLVNATTIIYCFVYAIMAVGIIKLRKAHPEIARPFRIGKKGNGLIWALVVILMAVMAVAIFFSVYYSSLVSAIFTIVVAAVLFIAPLIINKKRNPKWVTDVQQEMGEEPENIPETPLAELDKQTSSTPVAQSVSK